MSGLTDDGLYLPEIKQHSIEKINRHNYYAELFTASMRKKWPQLAYIGLFAGAGRARIKQSGQIVETSALSAIRLKHPFTKYIFVESDQRCINALRARIDASGLEPNVTIIKGNVNDSVESIRRAMPPYGPKNGLLSFCFVDPFSTEFKFQVVKELSSYRMDMLVLLMLGGDARRNLRSYLENPSRIGELIDDQDWIGAYTTGAERNIVRFLSGRFDDAMVRAGFLSSHDLPLHPVYAHGTKVLQYVMAYYSKSRVGQEFWREALSRSTTQLGLDF